MNYSIADIATIIEASKQELNPAVISHLLLDSRRLVRTPSKRVDDGLREYVQSAVSPWLPT